MQSNHDVFTKPLPLGSKHGPVTVLTTKPASDGVGISLDTIPKSIDAELIAVAPSAKGDNRAAISRHGRYFLWAFGGGVSDMTPDGCRLFVNTVHYAARHGDSPVLERGGTTRDGLFNNLWFARKNPGYLNTIKLLYVPTSLQAKGHDEIQKWLVTNRPYLRTFEGRRLDVDPLARELGIPNYQRRFLERCIEGLKDHKDAKRFLDALILYTGRKELGTEYETWRRWFEENKNYLFFSDSESFTFQVDAEAKAKGVPSETLRSWSSEKMDLRCDDLLDPSWKPAEDARE